MKKSESIAGIANALRGIQKKLPAVGKDSSGQGYDYASLPEVCRKVYPLTAEFGLSISQILDESSAAGPAVTTLLMHESGEFISGSYPLAEAGMKMKTVGSAQQFGAAITYARRYGLLAVLGIPVDDDDAACLNPEPAKGRPTLGKTDKKKAFQMIEASGDFDQVENLCKMYKKQAIEEGWADELSSLYQERKDHFSG